MVRFRSSYFLSGGPKAEGERLAWAPSARARTELCVSVSHLSLQGAPVASCLQPGFANRAQKDIVMEKPPDPPTPSEQLCALPGELRRRSCLLLEPDGPWIHGFLVNLLPASLPRRQSLPPLNPQRAEAPLTRVVLRGSPQPLPAAAEATENQQV